ncbi:hypothetical protein TcasGA2_TC004283 [Tribolium castaneum]|uniref:Uncharacterized protein n=1 Tax=Tribolium castaneum TaxID=7070 RepID=D7EK28_TRICA|nr:hypothetical protein TcasGA2_TC004283 [Tribolium castaneum]
MPKFKKTRSQPSHPPSEDIRKMLRRLQQQLDDLKNQYLSTASQPEPSTSGVQNDRQNS